MVNIGNSWDNILKGEFEKEYYQKLRRFLITEYRTRQIYPDMYDIFNALRYTSYEDVKAVIIGQDPYHQPGQAHGLCFSVKKGVRVPPSLVNIFRELNQDTGADIPEHGCLTDWARSGVLLLNTILTVRRGSPLSHANMGWEILTDRIISLLNEREKPVVFILWGANAKAKKKLITESRHLVLEGAHPSPLGAHRGFWNGRYFSKTNEFLEKNGMKGIDWEIR